MNVCENMYRTELNANNKDRLESYTDASRLEKHKKEHVGSNVMYPVGRVAGQGHCLQKGCQCNACPCHSRRSTTYTSH